MSVPVDVSPNATPLDPAAARALDHLEALSPLVGNTPLIAIDFTFRDASRTLYAKLESLNLTGSVKDRMALHVLRRAYQCGALVPGGRIIEATSGNTGISFAALGRALGHPVTIFIPDWMSTERINLIRSLGADIELVSKEDGGFIGSIQRAEALGARTPSSFLPRQFSNATNAEAHELSTGPEILAQLASVCAAGPDAFVAGVGTGGTVMGVGKCLRARRPDVQVHPLEPSNSPTLSTGHKVGRHRIQGISDEFVPAIVDLDFLDDVLSVDDGDAILMAQALAGSLGLSVGISSGANFLGALIAQERLGHEAVVATVFPDSNKKYISTDLMRDEPVRHGFLSADVKLLRYRVFPRRCEFCPPAVRNQRPTEHTTDVAHTIIDLERRALERWGNGDPSGFLEICADDVVYFDPYQARRLNGIDELRALYESIRGQVSIAHFELVDPRVQAVDDVAVLTFNYVAQGTNEVTSRWNCTEVYRRRAGSWKIIQTHWSFTQPGGIGA